MTVILMVAEVGFAIWAAWGKAWFWYPINMVLLLLSAAMFTRAAKLTIFNFFPMIGRGHVGRALYFISPTVVNFIIAYCITYFVLSAHLQTSILVAIASATAIVDGLVYGPVMAVQEHEKTITTLKDTPSGISGKNQDE